VCALRDVAIASNTMSGDAVVEVSKSAGSSIFGDLFASNPYFNAGFGLLGLGAGLAIARRGLIQSFALLQRQLLVTLEIPSHDHSHAWFLHWMAKHQSAKSSPLSRPHHLAVETTFKQHENGSALTAFELVPGPGRHLIRWKGAWIQVVPTSGISNMSN
jgi:mitochondrial chaperone BCS1